MARLALWFSGQPDPQLVRATFEHPALSAPHNVIRGRVSPLQSKTGTFQWTSAVQALAILMLRTAAFQRGSSSLPVIEGTSGSLASSLDFALSKLPGWLVELFGRDSHDYPLARRLIQRENTGSKRAGPVSLGLSERLRKDLVVEIFLDNVPVTTATSVTEIAESIESRWRPHHAVPSQSAGRKESQPASEPPANSQEIPAKSWQIFRDRIRDEIQFSLRYTDIFSRESLKNAADEILTNDSFLRIAGKSHSLLAASESELLQGDSIQKAPEEAQLKRILGDTPIRVVMAAVPSAVTALFSHLQIKGFPVEIDAGYSDAGEIVASARNSSFSVPPDLITFGVGAAAELLGNLKRSEYRPIMLAPKHGARAIGASANASGRLGLRGGRFLALTECPSSGSFYLDALKRDGTLRPNQFSIEHANPAKMFEELRQGDPELRAIVHFPHHDLNVLFNNCRYLDGDRIQTAYFPGILFAHESLHGNAERLFCVTHALRRAWLELRDDGQATERALNSLLTMPGFQKRLIQCSGITQLREPIKENFLRTAL